MLDAVQVQSERRDTTPTFPWRWLEAGSITDFGKSCIYDAVTRDNFAALVDRLSHLEANFKSMSCDMTYHKILHVYQDGINVKKEMQETLF